jgi:hydroxymethylglutaryl-CoA synthase
LLAAKKLSVTNQQLKFGLLVNMIGNTYSGASILGLCNVLENAMPKQKILLTSYGSGAGADSFIIETTENIKEKQQKAMMIRQYLLNKTYIDYSQYRKIMENIA